MEARALAALLLVLLLASPAIAADRVDVYSKDVQRQGREDGALRPLL